MSKYFPSYYNLSKLRMDESCVKYPSRVPCRSVCEGVERAEGQADVPLACRYRVAHVYRANLGELGDSGTR